jgi:hypothetical protein
MPHPFIIVAWIKMDGSAPTDRRELRNGCYRTVYKTVPQARAVTWDCSGTYDKASAERHVATLNQDDEILHAAAYVYPATEEEPLKRAREEVMNDYRARLPLSERYA